MSLYELLVENREVRRALCSASLGVIRPAYYVAKM
jgi:hypothetical protein